MNKHFFYYRFWFKISQYFSSLSFLSLIFSTRLCILCILYISIINWIYISYNINILKLRVFIQSIYILTINIIMYICMSHTFQNYYHNFNFITNFQNNVIDFQIWIKKIKKFLLLSDIVLFHKYPILKLYCFRLFFVNIYSLIINMEK